MAGALQFQVETEGQFSDLLRVHYRQDHVDALAQPANLTAGNEVQALAVEFEFQRVFDAANVADTDGQKRLVELVIGEVFLDAQLGWQ
ncbi:hypothetical protein PS712_06019 [Pseudomonas fluorescens]|uniref:Uncharacterized protein n=1 Tax=Pseudomonas fluorescens TaxID=294 RepID=A0A5E7FW44_PSEFL|nr:hypothetical protein PS712_06019 [Pseudomonas fluorescens]